MILVSSDVVKGSHDTRAHVVKPPLWKSAIENSNGQIRAEEGVAGVESRVARHGHVKSGQSGGHTSMLGAPITHDEALETKLSLQKVVQGVRVGAPIAVVDLVVGTHDGAGACTNCVSKWPQVQLMHCYVVDI